MKHLSRAFPTNPRIHKLRTKKFYSIGPRLDGVADVKHFFSLCQTQGRYSHNFSRPSYAHSPSKIVLTTDIRLWRVIIFLNKIIQTLCGYLTTQSFGSQP
jgi:hypothetical protein